MKYFALTCLLTIAFFSVRAQKGELTFDEKEYDFGYILEAGGPVSHTFSFTNTGSEAIKISRVRASCGCTTPTWSNKEIAPGESGEITAQYNPKHRPGRFRKSIAVASNAKNETEILFITGNVVNKLPEPEITIFEVHFDQNTKNFAVEDDLLAPFTKSVKNYLSRKDSVVLQIESSASTVPAHWLLSNERIATKRAKAAQNYIFEQLAQEGIDTQKVILKATHVLVQGPAYKKGDEQTDSYREYQYIKIVPVKNDTSDH